MKMEEKRDKNIIIRVSEREKKAIQKRAKLYKVPVSEYARNMMIQGEVNLIHFNDLNHINKIGNNLNQMTKILHFSKSYNHSELENLMQELKKEIKDIKTNYWQIED